MIQHTPAELAKYERYVIRWMRMGLAVPAIAGLALCAAAVTLFIAEDSFREHEAVLIAMIASGALLILGGAAVAVLNPKGFATYLSELGKLGETVETDQAEPDPPVPHR